jgi:5'-AMP-activated protein kinase regulatory gamma subunit
MSGADTADSATPAPPNPPTAANDAPQPHDRPTFVTPRDFLEQGRPILPPRALTAVDREQLDGLVRASATPKCAWANCETEDHPRLPQGADELRCAAAQLPLDRLRHGPARQEEPKHPHTKWSLRRMHPTRTGPANSAPGIVSAPLWDSKTSTFAGLLTTSDYLNVIQYYWQNPDALARVDQFRLNSLRGKLPHARSGEPG